MIIDYTSDLHLDIHIKYSKDNIETYNQFWSKYFKNKRSDYLIIAGDLGHDIEQNLIFFKYLKEKRGYKDIFTVEGNHSGYLIKNNGKEYIDGLEKIKYTKEIYLENGIKVLDGNYYTLQENEKEILIGGCDSFYDGSFYKLYKNNNGISISEEEIVNFWKMSLNDSYYMNILDFHELFESEKKKLEYLKGKCDIMVTHVKPVNKKEYFSGKYKNDLSNAFFSFDWEEKIISEEKLKVWIYGHTHEIEKFNISNKRLLCNPYGYPHEITDKKYVRNFEI
jgi:predicted phosphodiesterase